VFVVTAVYARTERKYGAARSPRYVHLEAGHAAQNLLLQAVALGLGAVPIGAFDDEGVQEVLGIPEDHRPLYLIPVGRP
jgi:SagB-type dehydrogenase family enzyme